MTKVWQEGSYGESTHIISSIMSGLVIIRVKIQRWMWNTFGMEKTVLVEGKRCTKVQQTWKSRRICTLERHENRTHEENIQIS